MSQPTLARNISLPLLTFYGLGTILGAGIYVLIGEVSARAGIYSSISFIVAAIIAAITAYSFAKLSSLFPRSAGEAAYAHAAFQSRIFSTCVGLAVVLVGTISAATMVNGFAGYFLALVDIAEFFAILGIVLFIAVFSIWGIRQSLNIAAAITIIEVLGLVFVIFAATSSDELVVKSLPPISHVVDTGPVIFYAAFICFYAYIGFEDIVNIAEETLNPTKVVPLAILLSLVFSTLLYVTLSITSTLYVPTTVFATTSAPLVAIVEYQGYNPIPIAVVSIIAIVNGALVQLIMASRVLYGMGCQNMIPNLFAKVSKRTRTPVLSTLTVTFAILLLSMFLNLVQLAEITSAITLGVFIAVQSSLLYITAKKKMFRSPDFWVPSIGICLNFFLLYFGFAVSST